jgi:hypothetical protein
MYHHLRNDAKAENASADEHRSAAGAGLAQGERGRNAPAPPMSRPSWAWLHDSGHYDWMDWHTPSDYSD